MRLGPSNLRDGRLRFTYSKNGSEMDIPIAAPLAEVVAKTNMTGTKTFLVTDYGKPFTAAGFGNWFVNRRPILTPDRRPILTPSFDVVGR